MPPSLGPNLTVPSTMQNVFSCWQRVYVKPGGSPELNCQSNGKQAGLSGFLQTLQRQRPCRVGDDVQRSFRAGEGCAAVPWAWHTCPEHSVQVRGHLLGHKPPPLSSTLLNTRENEVKMARPKY